MACHRFEPSNVLQGVNKAQKSQLPGQNDNGIARQEDFAPSMQMYAQYPSESSDMFASDVGFVHVTTISSWKNPFGFKAATCLIWEFNLSMEHDPWTW